MAIPWSCVNSGGFFSPSVGRLYISKYPTCFAISRQSNSESEPEPSAKSESKSIARKKNSKGQVAGDKDENSAESFPMIIPRKPRRGRRSEAVAVEDFIRDSLQKTFASIKQKNPERIKNKENLFKSQIHEKVIHDRMDDEDNEDERANDSIDDEDSEGDGEEADKKEEDGDDGEIEGGIGKGRKKKLVVEDDSSSWPLDAEVGWGIRASDYFEQHPIRNVVGEDGHEIDWEGEIDDNWVQEINSLEWESYAFHPSPLMVLVFERYNRATDNWKNLKELEKAIKVYWSSKDKLPPRAVKIDINLERDLAFALGVRECPEIIFLRGRKLLYREKELRSADELVQMIAFFYYNAKRPAWIDDKVLRYRF